MTTQTGSPSTEHDSFVQLALSVNDDARKRRPQQRGVVKTVLSGIAQRRWPEDQAATMHRAAHNIAKKYGSQLTEDEKREILVVDAPRGRNQQALKRLF